MILIGENLNARSKILGPALRERKAEPVIDMANAEDKADVDYLDLNVGHGREVGGELVAWVVSTVQQVTSKPLSLDTSNPVATEAGLKVCSNKTLINSISVQPDSLTAGLPLVNKYNADMIGLLRGVEGIPRDAYERCMLAVDLVYKANEHGIANERIWIDPIVTPINGEINQVRACFKFMSMLRDICPSCKSIVGISNVSSGTHARLRPYLNRTFLIMMMRYGLYAAIVDAFDKELIDIARGRRPELVNKVNKMMDGEMPHMKSLTLEETMYIRMVRVLNGEALHSYSWAIA